jgi:hypothetical protein
VIVPLWLRCVLAALLLVSVALAVWGRPPRRAPRSNTWPNLAGLGLGLHFAGCGTLISGRAVLSAALIGSGVEVLSIAAWLGRATDPEEDEGPEGDGGSPDDGGDNGPPGWDDGDERAFWDYVARRDRPREPAGV